MGSGAGLNFGMVQDAFGKIPVSLVDDSFPPFTGTQDITPCLQGIVRPLWGLDQSLPSDCAECSDPDGGIANIVPYWLHKYPKIQLGLVSSIHDQIIRLFLAAGQNNCHGHRPELALGPRAAGKRRADLRWGPVRRRAQRPARDVCLHRAHLVVSASEPADPDASDSNGAIDTLHEHIFRPRFYEPLAGPGQPTLAQWMGDFVQGKLEQIGP